MQTIGSKILNRKTNSRKQDKINKLKKNKNKSISNELHENCNKRKTATLVWFDCETRIAQTRKISPLIRIVFPYILS